MGSDITVVIPAYNRVDLLGMTLAGVSAAARYDPSLKVECLVVDDGSDPPLEPLLADAPAAFPGGRMRVLRQANAGSLVARLHGLREANGEFVQFLDSDDQIHPTKLAAHVKVMRATGAEVSYCDQANAAPYDPRTAGSEPPVVSRRVLPVVRTPAELFLDVQVSPHTPVFRRDALRAALADPIVPPDRLFDPAGDTWLFFNCTTRPWRAAKVDGAYAIYIVHDADRYTAHWERVGVASCGISLTFLLRCPDAPATATARAAVGAAALESFRRLPLRFHPEYERLTLAMYRAAPKRPNPLGSGRGLRTLARMIGPAAAVRFVRRVKGTGYAATCQTLPREEVDRLVDQLVETVKRLGGADRFRAMFG